MKIKIYKTIILLVVLYGCEACETQAKGIWKQDPEVNSWAQEGWEWGMDNAPQWGTS